MAIDFCKYNCTKLFKSTEILTIVSMNNEKYRYLKIKELYS